MQELIQPGERILLCQDTERSYMIRVEPGGVFSSHLGAFAHDDILGRQPGQWVRSHQGKPMLILRPTTADQMMKVRRQTNIIYPKDAAQILLRCGIVPGTKVLEVGTGSASLTIALALAVGEQGRVYSYDIREDLQDRGRRNVQAAGLEDRVEFALRSPGEPFGQEGVDVVTLDVPTPWVEVEPIAKALKLGGRLASLNPTYNQIEQFAVALDQAGFVLIEAEEILWRRILARPGRTRPEQRMVGHTEFLMYAVRAERQHESRASAAAEAALDLPETVELVAEDLQALVTAGEPAAEELDAAEIVPLSPAKALAGQSESMAVMNGAEAPEEAEPTEAEAPEGAELAEAEASGAAGDERTEEQAE
jgi:tRNA (adenine57-N1/adenine58-N1)-methyltransferase catalytic subunit